MYIEKRKTGFKFIQTYFDDRTGKTRRVSVMMPKSTGQYRRDAQEILAAKIRKNNGIVTGDLTMKEAVERYLAANKERWRPVTYRRNKGSFKSLCRILGDDTRICKLSARYVADRFAAEGLAPTTMNEYQTRLKSFAGWCYKNDYLKDNSLVTKMEHYPAPSSRIKNAEKYLEKEELLQLLPELKIDINRYMILFLALSGLRIGEALALEKDDVDLNERVIRVNKTMDHATKTPQQGAKTDMSNREVYIQQELFDLCKEIRTYMAKMAILHGFRTNYFFADLDGEPLQYARLNKYFREKTEAVLGRRLTLHSLRHTHASLMFEAGATLDSVAVRLGHQDSRITREIYLHVTDKLREKYNQQFDSVKLLS